MITGTISKGFKNGLIVNNIEVDNVLKSIPDLAAIYDFTRLPLGACSLVKEPIQGLNLAQTTGSRQPIAVDYLGSRCLYFDGSDDYMDAISTTGLYSGFNSGTMITVQSREDKTAAMNVAMYSRASNAVMFNSRYSSTTTNQTRMIGRMAAETSVAINSSEDKANGAFTYTIGTATRNGSVTIKSRGIAKASQSGLADAAFTPTTPVFTVGTNYNSTESSRVDYFKGHIKAIICFNRALTDDEVTYTVEPYLLKRFGV
jgi:hypothetical protein